MDRVPLLELPGSQRRHAEQYEPAPCATRIEDLGNRNLGPGSRNELEQRLHAGLFISSDGGDTVAAKGAVVMLGCHECPPDPTGQERLRALVRFRMLLEEACQHDEQ